KLSSMLKRPNDGPSARISTFFGSVPVIMKPPMPTLSPVWTNNLVERFAKFDVGAGRGVGISVETGTGNGNSAEGVNHSVAINRTVACRTHIGAGTRHDILHLAGTYPRMDQNNKCSHTRCIRAPIRSTRGN